MVWISSVLVIVIGRVIIMWVWKVRNSVRSSMKVVGRNFRGFEI